MVKKFFLWLVIAIIPIHIALGAESMKIVILPFTLKLTIEEAVKQGILHKDNELFKKTINEIKQKIKSKPNLLISKNEFDDVSNPEQFMKKYGLSPYPKNEAIYDADFLIFITPEFEEPDKYIQIQLAGIESGKEAVTRIDITQISDENFASLITEKIMKGLEFAEDLVNVNAEEIIDAENSVVQFELPTLSGDKILMNVDYGWEGEDKKLQDLYFFLPEKKPDGTYAYDLLTEQNQKVKITFFFENGEYSGAKIDTDFRPQRADETTDKILTIRSLRGYRINFKYSFLGTQIINVQVYPEVNPYNPVYREF